MSDRFNIPASEHGIVRLFTIDLPAADIPAFAEPDHNNDKAPWPLLDALAATGLDENFIEVFPVSDLGEMGLAGYMTEGLGIAGAEIAAQRPQLDRLKGHVLIVLSSAFGGRAQTLAPQSPLRWIGTWSEDRPPVAFSALPSDAARGSVAPPPAKAPVSDAAMSGRVATVALLVIFALVGVMIWVGS